MFIGAKSDSANPGHGSRGYSLFELVASILLIAGIAVLSLPTYKDFSPHEEFAGEIQPQVAQEQAESLQLSHDTTESKDQPVDQPETEKGSSEALQGKEQGESE